MPGIAGDGSEDLPNRFVSPVPAPAQDYLKQKLHNAYGELKIIEDNIQLLKANHISQLLELNSMVSNILLWAALDAEEQEAKG